MPFSKGKSGNPKGGKKGHKGAGGRPPDWFVNECKKALEKGKIIGFIMDVATGKDVEQCINQNGECLKVPASVRDRLKASEMLMDRALGKPTQNIESNFLTEFMTELRQRYDDK